MSSCILLSRIKGRLAEEKNILVIGVITFCYFFGIILSINGLIELYKSNTFIIHHCQVKSIDLDIQKSNFYPRWNITVTDKNETRNDTIISSTRFSSEECAWNKAHQYKVRN